MSHARRKHTPQWDRPLSIGQQGMELVGDLLDFHREPSGWFRTINYRSVKEDISFQPLGVDLLWCIVGATCACCVTVEVRSDQHAETGNFFFETVSDLTKGTRGAFVSSMAEWFFYAFPKKERVYCLPFLDTREWFMKHEKEFSERRSRAERNGKRWNTLGKLVPVERAMREVPGTRAFGRHGRIWFRE